MVGAESMLGWVEHVVSFPCSADVVRDDAGLQFAEDFQQADRSEVFYVVEFGGFRQWDEPSLLPKFRYVLSWPEGAEHLVRGFVEVLGEGLQVST